nr:hypothetical protein [Tanacetum cinerariifolium]
MAWMGQNTDIKDGVMEIKDILRQNLVKCNKLMVDTDYELKIALCFNPEDKELKKMIGERNNLFLDFYKKEDNNENLKGGEIDGDENGNTNENALEKGHNKETECDIGREEVEWNKDKLESTVNATVESTVNVVVVLSQICVDTKETEAIEKQQKEKNIVQAKGSGTAKKQVEVEKAKLLKEKRTVNPSSNFYDRRVKISEPLSEEEKKLVEYIWSDICPEGDIVFARKCLELECLWFLSLYPEIKVAANVIDA